MYAMLATSRYSRTIPRTHIQLFGPEVAFDMPQCVISCTLGRARRRLCHVHSEFEVLVCLHLISMRMDRP